jgi:signal transduction histidine kinase
MSIPWKAKAPQQAFPSLLRLRPREQLGRSNCHDVSSRRWRPAVPAVARSRQLMATEGSIDGVTLRWLHSLHTAARQGGEWKVAVDRLLSLIRPRFMYDNAALYTLAPRTRSLEVRYARAAGRGRTSEADVSWGEGIAGKVVAANAIVVEEPAGQPVADRLAAPYLMGLPVLVAGRTEGVLVFVRFGGPVYTEIHRQLGEWLADAVGGLLESRALLAARTELESARRQMRVQEDFVSNISHELRTPLGFIKGYSSSLLREDTTWDKATEREFLHIVEDEADRLTGLIENMLESARFKSKTAKFSFKPLQLDDLVRDVVARLRAHRPELRVELDFERMPAILGDSVRLSQVFENLFGNAVKYAPGSPLRVGMTHDAKRLRVVVEDHGPGIPEEYLPFVFERFYRVPADSSSTGTGLGLYICSQIVKAHHGKIWVESVLDRGTTFKFELPLAAAK